METFELTAEEMALAENTSWLLSKQRIIQKVYALYGELSADFGRMLNGSTLKIPAEVMSVSPKIYRGEQYRQLPYVLMDHPRYFRASDVFAVRSLFWWGNHFSIHLVLGGEFKRRHEKNILGSISAGALNSWYYGVSPDPWQHHFMQDNYIPVKDLQPENIPDAGNYLKLGRWLPLSGWAGAGEFYTGSFRDILEVL